MAITYEPIATTTLSSDTSTIYFSSIPATYTDLRIVFNGTAQGGLLCMRFNGSDSTLYSTIYMVANPIASYGTINKTRFEITSSSIMGVSNYNPELFKIDVFGYTTSAYKSILAEGCQDLGNVNGIMFFTTGSWRGTSVINEITLFNSSGLFLTGTTATLYGILKA